MPGQHFDGPIDTDGPIRRYLPRLQLSRQAVVAGVLVVALIGLIWLVMLGRPSPSPRHERSAVAAVMTTTTTTTSPYVTAVISGVTTQISEWISSAWCKPVTEGRFDAGANWSRQLPVGVSPKSFSPPPPAGQLAAVVAGRRRGLDFSDSRALLPPSAKEKVPVHGLFCVGHIGYPKIAFSSVDQAKPGSHAPSRLINLLDFPVEIEMAFAPAPSGKAGVTHLVFETTARAVRVSSSYNLSTWDATGSGKLWLSVTSRPPAGPRWVPPGAEFSAAPIHLPPGAFSVRWKS
jgi:hypothetical protein